MLDFTKMENAKKIELLQSKNEEALNTLINDENDFIRGCVATYGNDKHRDVLVYDEEWYIRKTVAIYGNDFHRAILVNGQLPPLQNVLAFKWGLCHLKRRVTCEVSNLYTYPYPIVQTILQTSYLSVVGCEDG